MLKSFLMPPVLAAFLVCSACDVPNDPPESPDPPEQQPEEQKDTQPKVPKIKTSGRIWDDVENVGTGLAVMRSGESEAMSVMQSRSSS